MTGKIACGALLACEGENRTVFQGEHIVGIFFACRGNITPCFLAFTEWNSQGLICLAALLLGQKERSPVGGTDESGISYLSMDELQLC